MTTAMSRLKPSPPVAVMLVVFGFGTAYAQNTPGAVTVPTVMGPVPVTADSYPLMAANKTQNPIDLSKFGYVEEEYFISGRANVYDQMKIGTPPFLAWWPFQNQCDIELPMMAPPGLPSRTAEPPRRRSRSISTITRLGECGAPISTCRRTPIT